MRGYQPKGFIKKPIPPSSGSKIKPGGTYIEGVVVESNSDNTEKLYHEFVSWAQYKNISPDQFRYIYKRYYDEFIGGL